ncbi:regulatory protein RecX [Methylomonas sp. AM2-LC]|uniref:regulatory protein RecX n=1 Tax=Methylomonas sp. AM2-LC TaxID=3153301 RepID=UPI003264A060
MMTASLQTAIERNQKITQICMRLLARREHSQRELLDKLALRGFKRQEVEPILKEMIAQNWQNDSRFVECYVRQRIADGYGPLRIRYELQQRGIDDVDLDTLADEYVDGWQNQLLSVYERKYDQVKVLSAAEWLKRNRFLYQRGFNAEMIKTLFATLKLKLSQ